MQAGAQASPGWDPACRPLSPAARVAGAGQWGVDLHGLVLRQAAQGGHGQHESVIPAPSRHIHPSLACDPAQLCLATLVVAVITGRHSGRQTPAGRRWDLDPCAQLLGGLLRTALSLPLLWVGVGTLPRTG